MKAFSLCFACLVVLELVACNPTVTPYTFRLSGTSTPSETSQPILTFTATPVPASNTPKKAPTKTPSPTRTHTPTPFPTINLEAYDQHLPLKWPAPPLSDDQLASLKKCDLEKLSNQRYPNRLAMSDLLATSKPQTDCDWAVLAAAYAKRFAENEPVPEPAKRVLAQVLARNPGFIFSSVLFYSQYFDSMPLVEAIPVSRQAITSAIIWYEWSGMGDHVAYTVKIKQADATPKVSILPGAGVTTTNLSPRINKDLVQVLGPALTDFLPVGSQFSAVPCDDNGPDWSISLTFKDGTVLDLKTNGSNFLFVGAPWQTTIDGQNYAQYSSTFARVLVDLVKGLGLPLGQPRAMTCFPVEFIDKAFP